MKLFKDKYKVGFVKLDLVELLIFILGALSRSRDESRSQSRIGVE